MSRVLVLTTEPLPLPGMPATGAGLRAWGLAQGLRAAGLDVTLLMPTNAAATFVERLDDSSANDPDLTPASPPDSPGWVATFDRAALPDAVREHEPDVIVLQHWGLARELGEVAVPLAIDLAGPHLLERRLWGSGDPEGDLSEKLDALRRADFLTASGFYQRLYFLPYLAMAGWPVEAANLLPVIPFSMAPWTEPAPPRHDRLIYGGFFLPWQDPSTVIESALSAMDAVGEGELLFIGGAHPTLDVSRGRFEALLRQLQAHPRVRRMEPMSFTRYQTLLSEGGVALDLMARNAERELAYTTRTVVYLAAGLPVLHDNYSELGGLIERAGAGWTFEPADRAGVEHCLREILRGETDVAERAQAARHLVERDLHWDKTIEPLAEFCRHPRHRHEKTALRLGFEERSRALEETRRRLDQTRRELATLKGKRWVRMGLALTHTRTWLRWPLAVLATLVGLALVPIFLLNDLLSFGKKE